jgi:integrase
VSKSITLVQAAEDWIKSVELEKRERATLLQYRQLAHHITTRIGNYKLASLTAVRLNGFRDELLDGMSTAMARKVLVALKSLLRDAQRRGSVGQNVALSLKRIDANRRGERRLQIGVDIPNAEEIKMLIAAMPERWRPMLLTAIFTGLRASELRGLRWEDVDLKSGELHVRQRADRFNAIGEPKSKAGKRTVPLGPLVLNTLRAWKLRCPRSELGLVFPTPGGGVRRHSALFHAFGDIVRKAGLLDAEGNPKYTGLHALRHFYASWCINRRADGGLELPLKNVQERLGHSTIVLTADRYSHLFPRGDDGAELAAAERALLGSRRVTQVE